MKTRNYKYDNIRILLMFLVVFAHLITKIGSTQSNGIYKIIYSFHMPAFFFLSGYFAKLNGKKWCANYLYTYIMFQIIYGLVGVYILHEESTFSLTFTTPQYVLWYLVTLMTFVLLIPVLDSVGDSLRNKIFVIVFAVIGALIIGYDTEIGLTLSFARVLSFLPFFAAGYYIGHGNVIKDYVEKLASKPAFKLILTVIICGLAYYVYNCHWLKAKMMYGRVPYVDCNSNITIKLFVIIIAAVWTLWLFVIVPNKQIPFISELGQHTYPIFIIHGILIKLIRYYDLLHYSPEINLLLALPIAVIIIVLLGNKYVYKAFMAVCTGNWLIKKNFTC